MRLLILGATGLLGHKLWQRLPQTFPDTWALTRRPRAQLARYGLYGGERVLDAVDALDARALAGALEHARPDVILNCIGVTRRREHPDAVLASIESNAALPHRLAAWAGRRGARLVSFSTDCVFSGAAGGYDELAVPDATDLYGRTKALGEIGFAPHVLTLRASFIGREIGAGTELLEWFLANRGNRIRGFRGALYTGISTIELAGALARILAREPPLGGLYNLAGETITKYDLLCLARDAFGARVEIEPDDAFVCKRNLDGARLRGLLGWAPPPWSHMMAALAADPTPYEDWK
ncbi:MAG: SDR family oxidoreductase [Burkholderiales bacterium]|nr:SDR family oxidoreductase [Burkholderiales bacterium]